MEEEEVAMTVQSVQTTQVLQVAGSNLKSQGSRQQVHSLITIVCLSCSLFHYQRRQLRDHG